MSQKRIHLMMVCAITISLFLLASCGKKTAKSTAKPTQTAKTPGTEKIVPQVVNLVNNPSFEKAKVFDKGLYKKGQLPGEKSAEWSTHGQILDDFTGWVENEAHSGKRSLKIENIGGTKAYWQGKAIVFKQPANAFKVGIWVKKNIKRKADLKLILDVYTKGKDGKEVRLRVEKPVQTTKSGWELTNENVLFATDIVKVVPSLHFSGIGEVWFDDLSIIPCKAVLGKNIIPNHDIEGGSNNKVDKWVLNWSTPGAGWDKKEGYNTGKALKIVNKADHKQTFWYLKTPITINQPSKYYYLEGYVKANKWKGSRGNHTRVEAKFFYKDGSASKYYLIDYPKGTYNWMKKSRHIALPDYPVKVSIVVISSGSGSIWFDNLSLIPIYNKDSVKKK